MENLPYLNLLGKHEDVTTAIPDALDVVVQCAAHCFCFNHTHNGLGVYMGLSDCDVYVMSLESLLNWTATEKPTVTIHMPSYKQSRTLVVQYQPFPTNVTIGSFKDIWLVCGDKADFFLPYGWTGCCYMAKLKLPYDVLTFRTEQKLVNGSGTDSHVGRSRRELAQFHDVSMTFLADHIDNITYTL